MRWETEPMSERPKFEQPGTPRFDVPAARCDRHGHNAARLYDFT
jgi:hypothetical protein